MLFTLSQLKAKTETELNCLTLEKLRVPEGTFCKENRSPPEAKTADRLFHVF